MFQQMTKQLGNGSNYEISIVPLSTTVRREAGENKMVFVLQDSFLSSCVSIGVSKITMSCYVVFRTPSKSHYLEAVLNKK
jgi:hypothetical protein